MGYKCVCIIYIYIYMCVCIYVCMYYVCMYITLRNLSKDADSDSVGLGWDLRFCISQVMQMLLVFR